MYDLNFYLIYTLQSLRVVSQFFESCNYVSPLPNSKRREPNSAAALASQPVAGHSLSFIIIIVFYDLGLRPTSGTACRKLQPNLALMPYIYETNGIDFFEFFFIEIDKQTPQSLR